MLEPGRGTLLHPRRHPAFGYWSPRHFLRPNSDGLGTLLRLWEQSGRAQTVRVTLPEGLRPNQVHPSNLRGIPQGKPIPETEARFKVNLQSNAPVSLLVPETATAR